MVVPVGVGGGAAAVDGDALVDGVGVGAAAAAAAAGVAQIGEGGCCAMWGPWNQARWWCHSCGLLTEGS